MSHELRTPLNAIVGFGHLLSDNSSKLSQQDIESSISDIVSSGKEMLSLIEQILTFSEVSLNSEQIELAPFSINKVVESAIIGVTPLAKKKDISITYNSNQTPAGELISNRVFFKEILIIFMLNAIKYIQDGGAIELSCFENENGRKQINVKDNGPGVSLDHQDKLFLPFERLNHQDGPISGAGVGLSIAKMMAEQIGGKVGFRNNHDVGVTFWLELTENEEVGP